MKFVLLVLTIFTWSFAFAQSNPTKRAQPIVEEGKMLYRSEMASWYGTDIIVEAMESTHNIGGYFSYSTGDSTSCIFYSNDDNPKVIGTVSFDSTYNVETAILDLDKRDFTSTEFDLYEIRKVAKELIRTDTLFKTYQNTNLNLIPIINNGDKKVYVLTGPTVSGVVIFGNDYLITFNKRNKVKSKKQLHKNIIPMSYGDESDSAVIVGGVHSHLPETGDFMTATDICTLMLYSKFAKWETYNVISEKYLNIWDCKKNTLIVVSTDAFNKIVEDQEKRNN